MGADGGCVVDLPSPCNMVTNDELWRKKMVCLGDDLRRTKNPLSVLNRALMLKSLSQPFSTRVTSAARNRRKTHVRLWLTHMIDGTGDSPNHVCHVMSRRRWNGRFG